MKYIIWILVSAAIFGKSIDWDNWEWLAFPSGLSCVIGCIVGFLALCGITF